MKIVNHVEEAKDYVLVTGVKTLCIYVRVRACVHVCVCVCVFYTYLN